MNEMQRVLAALDRCTKSNTHVARDAARLIRELSRQLEAEEATNDRLRDEIAEAVGARERMAADVARWNDPESPERQKLQEDIIFSLGDGARSEVELREGQLGATEAALALALAELDRYRESDLGEAVKRLDETKDAEIARLRQERDEAIAARETYAMTAREDVIAKSKALDALEEWLRGPARSEAVLGPNKEIDGSIAGWSCELWRAGEYRHVADLAPTLAAAILDALRRAGS